MPFMARFSCLWCGRAWETRGPDDLEGWAQLCPDCVGAAGEDGFRRMRLRAGLAARAGAGRVPPTVTEVPAAPERPPSDASERPPSAASEQPPSDADPPGAEPDAALRAYYRARATTYDDWYLRRGAYAHGPIDDLAWTMDLDAATLWLDGLPLSGEIVELAAGTGWWSPLLAGKGELWCYDAVPETLDLARQRLLAHGLRAHLHARDAWAQPDRQVDALFCGFWLSHVPRSRLAEFLALCARWLKPDGTFAFIDSRADPASGSPDNAWDPATETARRRIDDRAFTIPKVYYSGEELEAALTATGFIEPSVTSTSRFFLLGSARREMRDAHRPTR
jgi:demethylmenaquinone methyltransferase/2-methoxy-6-polyprenyl-1,4-benzoquinol methylase